MSRPLALVCLPLAALALSGCAGSSKDDRSLGVRMADAFSGNAGGDAQDRETSDIPAYDYQPPDVTDAKARVAIHDQLRPRVTVFNAAARWRAGELSRVRVPARAISEVGDLGAQYRFTFYDQRGAPIDDGSDWAWKRMPPNEPVYFEGAALGGGAADWYLEIRPAGLFPHALSDETSDDPRTATPNQLRAEFSIPEARREANTRHGYLGPRVEPP